MSRSFKKAIIRDRPRNRKKSTVYWRRVRRVINQAVRTMFYTSKEILPDPKEIINDYDYSDYTIDYENSENLEKKKKHKRK